MPIQTYKSSTKKIPGGLAVESSSRNFRLIMDEPHIMGGTDVGAAPVEVLLMSLGSCLSITAYSFAESMGIDLQDFWVEVEGDLDMEGYLHGSSDIRTGFQTIRTTMHIRSSTPIEKLFEFQKFVKSRCPVTDTLLHGTRLIHQKITLEK